MSASGEAITLRRAGHPESGLAHGAMPAYLVFQLGGGEHIPVGIPTITNGNQAGEAAVGPLGLTPTSQAELNADLQRWRGVIVNVPPVARMPSPCCRDTHWVLAHAGSSASSLTSGTSAIQSMFGLTPQANWTIQGVPAKKITGFLQSGSKTLAHLASQGTGAIGKAPGLKVTPTASGVKVAVQIPGAAGRVDREARPSPAPEPSAWLTFGLILGAAGLWHGRGGSRNPRDPSPRPVGM